ncbi:hypothetical protein [Streptomyces noursei]|uniref:hypothetical protein n=1 Tax=Streptomyces noursei TaxID=1971 RepID=UPI0030F111B3
MHLEMLVRRHFAAEAMVFACLVEQLRCGDVAVIGAEDHGAWTPMRLPGRQCEPKLAGFCEQAGFPATASEFTARQRGRQPAESPGKSPGQNRLRGSFSRTRRQRARSSPVRLRCEGEVWFNSTDEAAVSLWG